MPHLNHRRGDTRRRGRNHYGGQYVVSGIGYWNRVANRHLRHAVSEVLQRINRHGYDDAVVFPVAHEVHDQWDYD